MKLLSKGLLYPVDNYLSMNYSVIHTDVKPYSCKYCFKKIRHASGLKKHEQLHTRETWYFCQKCDHTCIQNLKEKSSSQKKKCELTKKASEKTNGGKIEIIKENNSILRDKSSSKKKKSELAKKGQWKNC